MPRRAAITHPHAGRLAWAAFALFAVALAAACASGAGTRTGPRVTVAPPRAGAMPPGSAGIVVRVGMADAGGTRVREYALEEYVAGVVRAELPPNVLRDNALAGMLDIQAIVSRTYALANMGRHRAEGFDLCDGTHCQVFRPLAEPGIEAEAVRRAVAATSGLVLAYEGRPIQALFHADCGGHTAAAASVWGREGEPYLAGVPDWFCSRARTAPWTFEADGATLARALAANPAMDVGPRLERADVAERDASGRATQVALAGSRAVTVRAEAFRAAVMAGLGDRSLRSTRFSVTRDGDRFVFAGTGFGHGAGLCQAGALERVRAGLSPAAVLAHYYPGTRLVEATSLARPIALRP